MSRLIALSCSIVTVLFLATISNAQETRLDRMISPISNPINFEDPRITTELRPFYAYHNLNNDFVTDGGSVNAWAAQARVAITERLGFIATKDGYLRLQADEVLDDSSGALNLEAGFKYAAFVDEDEGQIFTVGLEYNIPTGDPDIFENQGDGHLIPFITGAMALGDINLMGLTGLRTALDSKDSSFWDLSLHADYPVGNFYPSLELNLFHVYDAGKRVPISGEGDDVLNIGSSRADGKTTVNLAVGSRYRFCEWADAGVAFEFPLVNNESVFGERLYVDVILKLPNWTLL